MEIHHLPDWLKTSGVLLEPFIIFYLGRGQINPNAVDKLNGAVYERLLAVKSVLSNGGRLLMVEHGRQPGMW
jgi:hypothetical protein